MKASQAELTTHPSHVTGVAHVILNVTSESHKVMPKVLPHVFFFRFKLIFRGINRYSVCWSTAVEAAHQHYG